MPFKVVQTIEKGKPVLTAVPHGWEKEGTLFWPKNQADKLIKIEDIYPEENWIPITCELKTDNICNYDEAQEEISSILYRGVGRHEQNKNQPVEASTSSQSRGNPVELKIESNSQDPLVYDEQTPAALSAGMELILENQRIMLENQKKIMRKLNDFTSKLDILMSRRSDVQCFDTNEYKKLTPIDTIQGLEEFEDDLKDPEKRNSFFKRYSIVCLGKGDGVSCAYFLADIFFTRKFMTKCSWSGGSRGETKLPFKAYNNVINFFHSLVHGCDKNFSLMDCHNFFKMILRNSAKRCESKCIRASGKRTRMSKNIMSEIQMSLVQGDVGYEYEDSRDGLEEDLNGFSKKSRKQSDAETSEGETDPEKELNESDGYIRATK